MSNLEESDKEKALRGENSEESAEDTDFTALSLRLALSDQDGSGEGEDCPLPGGKIGTKRGGQCVEKPKE